MITLDPRAGTHFNGKEIKVTSHAAGEARNKFNVSFKRSESFIRDNLRKSQYIGEILNERGEPARLFGYNRISFVLATDSDTVITVYPRKASPRVIYERVHEIITKEIRKNERAVKAMERRAVLKKADLRVELAETKRRLVRTRSDAVKLACEARIAAVREEIRMVDEDVERKRQERSTLLKGAVAYV